MNNFFSLEELSYAVMEFQIWAGKYIFTFASFQQIAVVAILMVLSWIVSRKLARWLAGKAKVFRASYVYLITSHIYISTREMLSLILTPLLLWAAVLIAIAAKWPSGILNGAASLVSAWAVIRLGSGVIRSRFWSETLALSVWLIAALNIVGWLDPTVAVLDDAVISFGGYKLSLLALLKGAIILGLLLWLAGIASEGLERALWRSHLSPSQKVLFHKLAKILFITVAVLFGLNVIGIDFTALAVFSGALGIGIGFGLQKVFANLMSGFILLMDKSIKPGDVIAVADTYGWVNRLGARHVSILTRDGKEHLIPNETLIIEPVENWSYTDGKIRIHIPIHVSYSADVPQVKQILLEAAASHPRILKEPQPVCLIKGFGDSAIDFEIRAWIEDPINGISNVRSGIYEKVWELFKERGVAIPFPQRDVNLNMKQVKEMIEMVRHEAGGK